MNCGRTEEPKSIISQGAHNTVVEFHNYFQNIIKDENMKLFNPTIGNVTNTDTNETFLSQDILNETRDFVVMQTIPAEENSFVLKNLTHYSIYKFVIKACSSTGICSPTVLTFYRTQHKEFADNIDSNSVDVLVEKCGINISWESPKEPNGAILNYKLKYRRTDIQNFHPIEICVPLTKGNRSRIW